MNLEFQPLESLVSKYGSSLSPEAFYWAVNECYHSAEAPHYEEMHPDHWIELVPIWEFLMSNSIAILGAKPLAILDIGSGTGLIGDFLARMYPAHVAKLVCLDPCSEMLSVAKRKCGRWPFKSEFAQGTVDSFVSEDKFDLVTINSVLHHVVDLAPFCAGIHHSAKEGGLLLTAHDPIFGPISQTTVADRRVRAESVRARMHEKRRHSVLRRIGAKVRSQLRSVLASFRRDSNSASNSGWVVDRVIAEANRTLMAQNAVNQPMTPEDIWTVTDFHVPSKMGSGQGIDITHLTRHLHPMNLVSRRAYHFHGMNWMELNETERKFERSLWQQEDPHGQLFCSIWRKPSAV